MIKIHKKMEQFKALTLAENIIKAEDAQRYELLKLENDVLTCAGSKRIMLLDNFNEGLEKPLENGFYVLAKAGGQYIMAPAPEPEGYPDVAGVMERTFKEEATKTATLSEIWDFNAWVHKIFTIPECQPCVNIDYLKAAFKAVGNENCEVIYSADNYPIMIVSGYLKCVIMPMSK